MEVVKMDGVSAEPIKGVLDNEIIFTCNLGVSSGISGLMMMVWLDPAITFNNQGEVF